VEVGVEVFVAVAVGVREGVTVALGTRVLVAVGVTGVRVGVSSDTALVDANAIHSASATSVFNSIRAL
jgi:hypothetical protein